MACTEIRRNKEKENERIAKDTKIVTFAGAWDLPTKYVPTNVPVDKQMIYSTWVADIMADVAWKMGTSIVDYYKDDSTLELLQKADGVLSAEIYGFYDAGKHDEYNGIMYKVVCGASYTDYVAVACIKDSWGCGLSVKSLCVKKNPYKKQVA